MHRRIIVIAALMCTLPAIASAWTLSTWVKSSGGVIQSPNVAGDQTATNGLVNKTYTTTSPVTVSVIPNAGYKISNLTKNGTTQTLADPTATYTTTVLGPPTQSVQATFGRIQYTLSAAVGPKWTVSPQSISPVYSGVQSPAKEFTFIPASGYSMLSIDIPGHTLNTDYRLFNATSNAAVTLPASPDVRVKVSFINVNGSTVVAGTFGITGANAGLNQTVLPGSTVGLDGSASTGATSYTWTQVSGPASVSLVGANTSTATFTAPSTLGYYQFKLTINGNSSSTTTVQVSNSLTQAVRTSCINCHSSQGIGDGIFSKWSSSGHKTNRVMCYTCHVGTNTGGHPGSITAGSVDGNTFYYTSGGVNYCATCHSPTIVTEFAASPHFVRAGSDSCTFCHVQGVHNPSAACIDCHNPGNSLGLTWPPGGLDFHNDYNGTNLCSNCHNLHNPGIVTGMLGSSHYNNITTGKYPASYVTSKSDCLNCHASTPANRTVRQQWANSGHAALTDTPWIDYDFKTMAGCVRCHTTTGFIAYSTGKQTAAWGTASDKTKEVLTCIGCHSDVANGIVRTVTPAKPFEADAYVNRNVGTSNICMNCHSGTSNGLSITSVDFTDQDFIPPHSMAAGGVLHGKGGYAFPNQTYAYYSTNTHRTIGMADSNGTGFAGPCVGCHMSAPGKHRFEAVSTASTGTISKVASVCANCHGPSLDDTTVLNARKTSFTNALTVLNKTLELRGYTYSPNYPYFSNTNWGVGQEGANVMGAAFNYVLLRKEPGAYAHNAAYVRKLVTDSIDAVYNNGTVSGDIDSVLASLCLAGAITQEQADGLTAYRKGGGCRFCHPTLGGAHAVHVGDLPDSASVYGDDGNYSIQARYRFSCGNCHPMDAARHGNGQVDLELYNSAAPGFKKNNPANAGRTGTGNDTACFNVYCHSSGQDVGVRTYAATPSWGGTFTGNRCGSCHGDPPSYTSGGAYSANANSHYTSSWDNGQFAEGGHLVGLHFDNIKKDPADSVQPLFPKAGGLGSGAGHGDPTTSTTISCPTCHAATVNSPSMQSAPGTAFDCAACHGLQASAVIADKSRHIDGTRDVVFMAGDFRSRAQIRLDNFTSVIKPLGWTRNSGYKTYDSYDSVPFSGSYNPGDKSCMTSCHLNQPVKWGDTNFNCFGCHADL